MPAPRQARHPVPMPLNDTDPFEPTVDRPLRLRARPLALDSHFAPHQHAWAQLACCASGLIRVNVQAAADGGSAGTEMSVVVTPSRAAWIPPLAWHAVTVIEAADLRTLYIDASVVPAAWKSLRLLEVSPLLRALTDAMQAPHLNQDAEAMASMSHLTLKEIEHAPALPMGVPLPGGHADRRLRNLCEAALDHPAAHDTLAGWARSFGASERTMARLFREQLGTSFQQWRQQVVIAHALPQLARGVSIGLVAAQCGYKSESAFSAMFKSAMGHSPRHFLGLSSATGQRAQSLRAQ